MRVLLSLLLAMPIAVSAQLCSEPSPVSYSGFGPQLTQADLSASGDYLDGLNTANFSLGTGVSDNNLCIQSNSDITTFLGVKLRNTTAPNDNTTAAGNAYFVEPGFSPDTQNGEAGAGPFAKWNVIAYAGLNAGAFDSVDVIVHLDFDPCFGYVEEDLLAINIGDELDNNILTSSSNVSSFGINTNLAYASIDALNNTDTPFDANTEGYYTFAIEIKDNCGNRKLWNEITVYVQSETTSSGGAVADANENGVYDDNELTGCQNQAACNFDCTATTNAGCDYTSCSGCTVEEACNYNSEATIEDAESCTYPIDLYGETYYDCAGDCVNDSDSDGVCDEAEVTGCKDASACNYDDTATTDADNSLCTYAASNADCNGDCLAGFVNVNGSCVAIVQGCTDSAACNYSGASANTDDGSCEYTSCGACLNENACNYNSGTGLIHSTSLCVFATESCDSCSGESDGTGTVVDGDTDDDGICNSAEIVGCQDNTSCNYDATATDAGTCQFNDALGVCGGSCAADTDGDGICDTEDNCTDTSACNYANAANEACESISCAGCTVDSACNYDADATISLDTCVYATNCDSCSGAIDGTGTVVSGDGNNNGICDNAEVSGCTNTNDTNYDPTANVHDETDCDGTLTGSGCNYCANFDAEGNCTDSWACNYGPYETADNVQCGTPCPGDAPGSPIPFGMITTCELPWACNFGNEGACEFTSCVGCMNEEACNYDDQVTSPDPSSCDFTCIGCTNPLADNYDTGTTVDDGSCIVTGCTTVGACNYEATANNDDGSCEVTSCVGCNEVGSCNYDASVTLNEPISCVYPVDACDTCSGATDGSGFVVDGDTDDDGTCDANEVDGCTDANACNYSAAATEDDSSCLYTDACGDCGGTGVDTDNDGTCDAEEIFGCTNLIACNYDATATENVGCDFTSCEGCMDPVACNYDDEATTSVPSQCQYPEDLFGADHFDCGGNCLNDTDNDGTCDEDEIPGCMDSGACNYNASATDMDSSCTYPASEYVDCSGACLVDEDEDGVCDPLEVYGCDIESACNYNNLATENDGSCEFVSCAGCTIESACNYDETATLSNNISCTYIPVGWDDCDQTICTDSDSDGNCDFDEPAGCIGEFNAPVISMNGMVETAADLADWSSTDFLIATLDDTGMEGITFTDYPGRLNDGRYSVTRVYSATDICGNTSEAGQLIVADASHAEGCTNPNATSYDADAINDDGSCDYSPACLGDLNLDSIVGTSDLLILLSSFGLPCAD